MADNNCGTCEFWLADNTGEKGVCRRFPPQVFPLMHQPRVALAGQLGAPTLGSITFFPSTEKICVCGEWSGIGKTFEQTEEGL